MTVIGRARAEVASLPRAIWVCTAIAIANAACWAVITPVFWVPDEPAHAGYAQYVAEEGKLPNVGNVDPAHPRPQGFGGEQSEAYAGVPFSVTGKPAWSRTADHALKRALDSGKLTRATDGQALNATANPPLYYILEAIPYRIFYGTNYLGRLLAMRLFSALFAGLTVMFGYLFLRQVLPGSPFAWAVGALALAFQPLLGFMSGGVSPDALAFAAGTAVLWAVARALRQGLDARTGAAIGVTMVVGLLTKPIVIGLLPGVAVALLVMMVRRSSWRPAVAGGGLALVLMAAAWKLLGVVSAGRVATPATATSAGVSPVDALAAQAGYVWQAVLPRLPFMFDQFPHYFVLWEVYFKGFIGRFGWNEYGFPAAWYWVALAILSGVVLLAGRALWVHRLVLRRRKWEALVYVALALGLVVAVEIAAYGYQRDTGLPFEQARYLFPVLGLYGLLMALAAVGGGKRWGPAIGTFLVVLAMGQSLFAQLLTLGRFYT